MAADTSYDVAVIGGGPGGYAAAVRAAQLGRSVVLIEKAERLGGVCLNWGCIPTKALLRQAELYRLMQRAEDFGLRAEAVAFDWEKLIARSRGIAADLAAGVEGLMRKNKVTVVHGAARLTPRRRIEVAGADQLEAEQIILATGSRPRSLPGIDLDGRQVISSREAMTLKSQPQSLAIVGGGSIGVEFAYFFNAFGTRVTLLEAEGQLLPREDPEVAAVLEAALQEQGIKIHTGVRVEGVQKGRQATLRYRAGDQRHSLKAEKVLMAVGVQGNTEDLGLEALGVRLERGHIAVDGRLQTSARGLWAIGDVTGPPQLAHAAAAQGVAAVEFGAGRQRPDFDRAAVPSCTYCQPQVASVGLSEPAARQAGHEIKVGRFPFVASGKARAAGDTEGMVKLVFGARYGEILGGTVIGAEATELIAEIGLAIRLEATYEELLATVHAHPTLSEGVMEAAGAAFGEAINI